MLHLQAADVYSFGVLLWELCAGQRAWASLNPAQVLSSPLCRGRMLFMGIAFGALRYDCAALP